MRAMLRWGSRPGIDLSRVNSAVAELELPEAVWKTVPWQPRELIDTGLRQWLRSAGAAMQGGQVIGMPSRAVDEAWHGFILCTERYATFCLAAYGRFLHHHPDGGGVSGHDAGSAAEQLGRTVVAWSLVARADEACVLWDVDARTGVDSPWGVPAERVAAITAALRGNEGR